MIPILLAALLLSDAVPVVRTPTGYVEGTQLKLRVAGEDGLWFPLIEADECADYAEKWPLVQRRMMDLERRDLVAGRELATLRSVAADGQKQAEILQAQLERVIESRDAWHRSPALWMATGVIVTLVGVLAVAR